MRFLLLGAESAPRFGRLVAETASAGGLEPIHVRPAEWASTLVPLYRLEGGEVLVDLWTPGGEARLCAADHLWAFEIPSPPEVAEYLRREWEALTFAFLRECPARVWNRVDLLSPFWTADPLSTLATGLHGLRDLRPPHLAFAPASPGPGWARWPRAAGGGTGLHGVFWRAERPGPLHLALLVGGEVLLFRTEPTLELRRDAPEGLLADLRALGERFRLDYLEVLAVPGEDGWTTLSLGSRPVLAEVVAERFREPLADALLAHLSSAVPR